jgi:ubiquinone/menaquinone biosynthesis C-methylase UbiE
MSYERLARFYKLIESITIGPPLLNARLAHLDLLAEGPTPKHVLLIGEGNGSFLLPFAQRFQDTQITVIDQSAAMLEIAQSRALEAGIDMTRIFFRQADMQSATLPTNYYDLIVTLFFFDNFDESTVCKMITALEGAATVPAQWLLADFQIPEHGWRRLRARFWLAILYGFFRAFAAIPARHLPPIEAILNCSNFKQTARKTYCGQMLYSTLYQRSV